MRSDKRRARSGNVGAVKHAGVEKPPITCSGPATSIASPSKVQEARVDGVPLVKQPPAGLAIARGHVRLSRAHPPANTSSSSRMRCAPAPTISTYPLCRTHVDDRDAVPTPRSLLGSRDPVGATRLRAALVRRLLVVAKSNSMIQAQRQSRSNRAHFFRRPPRSAAIFTGRPAGSTLSPEGRRLVGRSARSQGEAGI